MTYKDSKGKIALIGCEAGPRSGGFLVGEASGIILVRYAVEKAQKVGNYRLINGLRSQIDGLVSWLGVSAHSIKVRISDQGWPVETIAKVDVVPDISLSQNMNLIAKIEGSARGPDMSEITFRSTAWIQTMVEPSCCWEDHLAIHRNMRDLLRVAGWENLHFLSYKACNSHESCPRKEGKRLQEWRDVKIATADVGDPQWREQDNFLFRYPDIRNDGIDKWLCLKQKYQRGLDPFIGLLDLSGATIDAVIAQLGIALEAIGYQALVDSGLSGGDANRKSVRQRIEHFVSKISDGVLSFDASRFGEDFANSYNSVKHVNRTVVDPMVKQELVLQGVELVRKWIGLQLGVNERTLKMQWR